MIHLNNKLKRIHKKKKQNNKSLFVQWTDQQRKGEERNDIIIDVQKVSHILLVINIILCWQIHQQKHLHPF